MGIITLKIDDDVEDKLRKKVGRDRGAVRGAISSSVEDAIRAWLQEDNQISKKKTPEQTKSKPRADERHFLARKGEIDGRLAEANTLEALSIKLRDLGIDPRSVIIESVPPTPLIRKMGLRITRRRLA